MYAAFVLVHALTSIQRDAAEARAAEMEVSSLLVLIGCCDRAPGCRIDCTWRQQR